MAAQAQPSQSRRSVPDPRAVFVVHGRNRTALAALKEFLVSADLAPITFEEAIPEAAKAAADSSPFIGEILDKGFEMAQAVVVLLTGDDVARLKRVYGKERLEPQARPNVLLEAGMARERFPDRTILVQAGDIRGISDLSGRYITRLDDPKRVKEILLAALKRAGCPVNERTASDRPFRQPLCEGEEAEGAIEMGRRRFRILCATLFGAGLVAGFGASTVAAKLWPPVVSFRGPVNLPRPMNVRAFLSVAEAEKYDSGEIQIEVQAEPQYKVLYAVRDVIVNVRKGTKGETLQPVNVDEAFLDRCPDPRQPKARPIQ